MANELEARVTDLENRVFVLEELSSTGSSRNGRKKRNLSVNEFLQQKLPPTATDTVLAIAVYNERIRSADSVNRSELLALLDKAKQRKPKNISDLINRNIAKGYMEEVDDGEGHKKRWYVTNSGNELVDSNFNQDEQNS